MTYTTPTIRRMTILEQAGLMALIQYPGLLDIDIDLGEWQPYRKFVAAVQMRLF